MSNEMIRINSPKKVTTEEAKGEQKGERLGRKNSLENTEGIEENVERTTKGKRGDEATKRRKI